MFCECFHRLIRESLAADVSYYNREDSDINFADITFFVLRLRNRISRFKPRNVDYLVDCVNQAVAHVKWVTGGHEGEEPDSIHDCDLFDLIIDQCINTDLTLTLNQQTTVASILNSDEPVNDGGCPVKESMMMNEESEMMAEKFVHAIDTRAGLQERVGVLDEQVIEWSLKNTGPTHPGRHGASHSNNITTVVSHRYIRLDGGGLVFTVHWDGHIGYDELDVGSVIRASRPLGEYLWGLNERSRIVMLQKYPQLEAFLCYMSC